MEMTDTPQDMAQGRLMIEFRGERKQMPRLRGWLRPGADRLWCNISSIEPRLRFKYVDHVTFDDDMWECNAVWLHCLHLPNGSIYTASVFEMLKEAVNILSHTPGAARYTLLDSHDDAHRLGGAHLILTRGWSFVFYAMTGSRLGGKVLLAVARPK